MKPWGGALVAPPLSSHPVSSMSRIEELEKRLDADPNSRMFVQLAEEYRKAGLLDNAVEICEEGLKKHPQYPSARVALGRALLESESFSRAAEEFETVLAQVPDNILANKFLGETYHRMGRLDEALQKYQIAQTLAPDDAELEEKIQAARDESEGETPASEPPPEVVTPPPEPSTELARFPVAPAAAAVRCAGIHGLATRTASSSAGRHRVHVRGLSASRFLDLGTTLLRQWRHGQHLRAAWNPAPTSTVSDCGSATASTSGPDRAMSSPALPGGRLRPTSATKSSCEIFLRAANRPALPAEAPTPAASSCGSP